MVNTFNSFGYRMLRECIGYNNAFSWNVQSYKYNALIRSMIRKEHKSVPLSFYDLKSTQLTELIYFSWNISKW